MLPSAPCSKPQARREKDIPQSPSRGKRSREAHYSGTCLGSQHSGVRAGQPRSTLIPDNTARSGLAWAMWEPIAKPKQARKEGWESRGVPQPLVLKLACTLPNNHSDSTVQSALCHTRPVYGPREVQILPLTVAPLFPSPPFLSLFACVCAFRSDLPSSTQSSHFSGT